MPDLRIPEAVISRSRRIDADPGDVLFAGHSRGEIFIVDGGLLQIGFDFADGSRSVRIAGPGEVVGEDALLGEAFAQRVEALSESSILSLSMADSLSDLLICQWVMEQLNNQLRQASREIHWMRSYTVENRVQLHLLMLYEKTGGNEIPISQADFAHLVGATRETISTALNKLARAEVITLSRRSIQVIRPERLGLRRAAGGAV